MMSRRELLKSTGQVWLGAGCSPLLGTLISQNSPNAIRCINVVNFIREIEPRFKMDMLLPVAKQMQLLLEHGLPATWLLQFDALVSGPFVALLKEKMAKNHEVGFWFEMNEKHCEAAGVEWRGRPGYEWDYNPTVAFTIGYTEAERVKLAATAMREFKSIWGRYPSSVASWNLDSFTLSHLVDQYGVDAFAVCRDQIATDGFTIWGAPIAGYYPSKWNCWSPAQSKENQVSSPIFRMLGQDPVYYYEKEWTLPSGRRVGEPDTMEPVWTSGKSPEFVETFLEMLAQAPFLQFAYAQLGQENTFPWPEQADGYPPQMKALAALRDSGAVHVETMGESGRRFKSAFRTTPAQAQVQLKDPFGNTNPAQHSVWYQSRFYRANLHLRGDLPFLRDVAVYSDRNPQPFLTEATRESSVEQRMPAVLDGYHWARSGAGDDEPAAGGFFQSAGDTLRLSGKPVIREEKNVLVAELPVQGGKRLVLRFDERRITCKLLPAGSALSLSFKWDPGKAALVGVKGSRASYRWQEFDYAVKVVGGTAAQTNHGWTVCASEGALSLDLAQSP